jgi:peptidoglycan/xylan/chitin deacetylase (PgdA/CDA1 family)
MLTARGRVPLLDYFGVPYELDDAVEAGSRDGSLSEVIWSQNGTALRRIVWPAATRPKPPAPSRIGSSTIFAAVAPEDACAAWLEQIGSNWEALIDVHSPEGARRAAIWGDERGNIFLPFDPNEAVAAVLSEQYQTAGRSHPVAVARASAASAYYRMRPLVPRKLQIAARRVFVRAQARAEFPAWPIESSLHNLYDLLLRLFTELAQLPLPYLAPWPAPYKWALVLTHDVEAYDGYLELDRLRRIEVELGLRSSWNFVPRRYDVDDRVVRELTAEGHEVGVHGLYHDGRDLASRRVLEGRLPQIRAFAERWGAVGFRSPALRRSAQLMPLLPFEYDSSYPDSDPHGPDGGGCCSWLPFMIDDMVELPVTLPQDHTLFEILRTDSSPWHTKTRYVRDRSGMVLLLTHPDYMLDSERLRAYDEFLRTFAKDDTVWTALPREVSAWWRRRSASRLVLEHGRWTVQGEAAGEAAISFCEPGAALQG